MQQLSETFGYLPYRTMQMKGIGGEKGSRLVEKDRQQLEDLPRPLRR